MVDKKNLLFILFLLIEISAWGQSSYNELLSASEAVVDMYRSPEESYSIRIMNGANRFVELMNKAAKLGDEGDTETVLRAYEAFVSLLKKGNALDQLDKWNRHFAETIDINSPLGFNCYLAMCSAYKESYDIQADKAIELFEYKGDGSNGLQFMTDVSVDSPKLSSYDKARLLAVKGDLQMFSGLQEDADVSFEKALKYVADEMGDDSAEYYCFKMFQETAKAYSKDFSSALTIANEVKDGLDSYHKKYANIGKTVNGRDFSEYSSLLARIASYHKFLNNSDEELKYNELALESAYDNLETKTHLIEPYQAYCLPPRGPEMYFGRNLFRIKNALAENLYHIGKKDEALSMFKELISDYKQMANQTSTYETLDVSSIASTNEPLIALGPLCASRYPNDDEIQCLAYDCALQYKDFSIFTENLILRQVHKDRNPKLLRDYETIVSIKNELDKAQGERAQELRDEIKQKSEQLLVELDFSTLGNMLSINWQQIQEHLPSNALAIEFMQCQEEDGTKFYLANVLKSTGHPHTIKLCTDKDIQGLMEPYTSNSAYQLVWKPLEAELKGINKIYFSPAGQFHKLAIEYLPNTEGKVFGQCYEVYRLSSTRELTEDGSHPSVDKCYVVYGGIKYDIDDDSQDSSTRGSLNEDVMNSSILRSGIGYLPQTLTEMHNVSDILAKKGKVIAYEGIFGTEESFKQLSSHNYNIIHIATHGFYVPKYRKSNVTKLLKNPFNSLEEQSLSRAGLMMAGANNSLTKKPKSGEDGILTAKEISRLDLNGIDMIVLSACETGLGDIADEGVFGLQRGFKKAGVSTIVMSLWEVDDEATQIFMTEFYNNLNNNQEKRKAFVNAQRTLQTMNDGQYSDPKYWAAFIILDAI